MLWIRRQNETYIGPSLHFRTIAEILNDNGYSTSGISASPIVGSGTSMDKGFVYFDQTCGHVSINQRRSATDLNQQVFKWLDTYQSGQKPFFLYIHYMDPHNFYRPPPEFVVFGRQGYELVDDEINKKLNTISENFGVSGITDEILEKSGLSHADISRLIDLYDAEILCVDHYIGELFQKLKNRNLYDNTIIVMTADHGECFLEHNNIKHGGSLYKELINVPLIIRIPGLKGGKKIDRLVEQIDIVPTILEATRIDTKQQFSGTSFYCMMTGKGDCGDDQGMAEIPGRNIRTLMRGNSKLIVSPEEIELYNLSSDPGEKNNIKDQRPEMVDELQAALENLISRLKINQTEPVPANNKDLEMLKSLGYIK
ncbi:MAG: hypothetical protein A2161_18610 [Candidatus Schekmanbacteria bacterium RBG_13_48_7]|uniref:Sulfatase N-terminal domain-containing protein n=1 Tax=Candidatus Schekmanbacteria bacterium RBG_13_48_7 TaxID=1817878 RepID=A0A1F7S3L6_9BACT|nr:MAG: hypothetical protein A2161_18610 [Candidatus Schekmanbacteria bacterium RBG_13_48_7]